MLEFKGLSPTDKDLRNSQREIQNPRLSWITFHETSLECQTLATTAFELDLNATGA